MDDLRFDHVARAFAAAPSRRQLVKGLLAGALGISLVPRGANPVPVGAAGEPCIWDLDCAESEACVDVDGFACGLDFALCAGLLESDACGLNGICELVDGELACIEFGGESCTEPSDCFDVYGPYALCLGGQCHYQTTKFCTCEAYDLDVPATIVIHKLECPRELADDPYGNCHGNSLDGVEFAIGNVGDETFSIFETMDGGLIETELPAGSVYLEELAAYVGYGIYVYCSDTSDKSMLFNSRADDGAISFDVYPGATVVCDWYNLTDDGKKDEEPPSEGGQPDGGVKLPETGAGAAMGGLGQVAGLAVAAGVASLVARRKSSPPEV